MTNTQQMNHIKENIITVNSFVESLREHFEKEKGSLFVLSKDRQESVSLNEIIFSSDLDTEEKLFLYGRKRGWLEEIDQLRKDEPVEKMTAARILHQFLRIELNEVDETDWNRATELKDLFDCHTCVNHIAQVYAKGIIPARNGEKVFGNKSVVSVKEAFEMIERVFHKEKRLSFELDQNDFDIEKSAEEISVSDMQKMLSNNPNAILIDVRTKEEYEKKHFEGAINIPLAKILSQPEIVREDKNQTYLFYCDQGYQSKIAANCVIDHGYKSVYIITPFL